MQKQFSKHILSLVPSAKIESVRFRSVAFNKPTTELPSTDPSSSKDKDGRKHDRERAATWRAEHKEDDAITGDTTKKFLAPQEKKRIAFIKQEIHGSVDSVNAYVVFAHPPPTENWPKNLPPPKAVMDPYEAAKAAVRDVDGSVFLERTVRVDLVMKGGKKAATAEGVREMVEDPKATVFVGNLDFACKEEDVRAFFEALIVAERGEPAAQAEASSDEEEEDEVEEDGDEPKKKPDAKPRAWVKRVRLIRDKDTLLGKGFGYVQFTVCRRSHRLSYPQIYTSPRIVNASTRFSPSRLTVSGSRNASYASSAARPFRAHPRCRRGSPQNLPLQPPASLALEYGPHPYKYPRATQI